MKRIKRVYTNSNELIHLFAQKSQSDAKTGSAFFVQDHSKGLDYGTKLYSYGYHYLLCEFLDPDTVMINDEGYSVTTSKQISQTRSATSQYKQFYKTETNLDQVHRSIVSDKDKLARARKPEIYISSINALFASFNEFAEYNRKRLKLGKRSYSDYTSDKYKEIKAIVKAVNGDCKEFAAKLLKFQVKQEKQRKQAAQRELKEALVKFNTHEINTFRIAGIEDRLRLSKDKTQVETSQGISIDRDDAKILYKSILTGVDIAGQYISSYKITSINGTLKIGCHNINMESVHTVGKQLI